MSETLTTPRKPCPLETIQKHLSDNGTLLKTIELPGAAWVIGLQWWSIRGNCLILQMQRDDTYELFIPLATRGTIQEDMDFITQLTQTI